MKHLLHVIWLALCATITTFGLGHMLLLIPISIHFNRPELFNLINLLSINLFAPKLGDGSLSLAISTSIMLFVGMLWLVYFWKKLRR